MIIPIIYPSSGEFWLQHGSYNSKLTDLPTDFRFAVNSQAACDVADILGLSRPLFLSSPDEIFKRKGPNCVIRFNQYSFPPNSFIHLKKGGYDIFIACPGLTFMIAARTLDLIDLILFGYELCAIYHEGKYGRKERHPAATVRLIKEYVLKNSYIRGSKKALKALKYIRDHSNSPMETKLAVFSVLPPKLGGCGLSNLEMNRVINLTDEGRLLMGCTQLRGDLVFNEILAVEYNSNAFHLTPEAYTNDMNRQTAMHLAGFHYIGITSGNVKYYHSIIATMNAVRLELGMSPLDDNPAREELYYRLFKG